MKKFAMFLICLTIICALCACGETEPELCVGITPPLGEPVGTVSGEPVVSAEPDASDEPSTDASNEPYGPPAVVLHALSAYEADAWGDEMREFVRGQTESWHELVNTVTVSKFRQGEFIMVYGYTLRFYEFGYNMTPRDENAEAPYGWRLVEGKLYRDDGETRYVVMYDRPGDDGYIPICELTGNQIESWYGNDLLISRYGDTETAALMTIYDSLIAGTELEVGNWWADYLEWLESDGDRLTVTDADGNDISAEIAELFARANGLFSEGNNDMFIAESDESGTHDIVYGYEEEVGAVFTARGRAQLQGTTEGFHLPLYRFRDGSVLKREGWKSGENLTFSLAETEILSVTADRIEMSIPYDVVLAYDENHELSVTECRWVDFAVAKTEDGWRVDNYPCPHAGVMEYDYESGDDICTPLFYASEADEIYYRPRTGRLYIKNPHWLSEDFGGAEVEIETRIDGALTYVELWLDGGELGMARFTANRDMDGEVLESEVFDWEYDTAPGDALMIEIAQSVGGITELTEGYVSALLDGEEKRVGEIFERERGWYEHNLELYDSEGRDISDEIINLWIMGNKVYGEGVFEGPEYSEVAEVEIFNFDEVMDAVYTDEGEAQVREAQFGTSGAFFTETEDGRVIMRRPGAVSSYSPPSGIVGASFIEQTAERIVLGITYDEAQWGDPVYETVRFTVEKEDGVWKIADYVPEMIWLPSREATLTVADGVEQSEILDSAIASARGESLYYDAGEHGFEIEEVVVEGVEEAASLEVASGGRMVMWHAKYRMRPDTKPTGDLGEYFEVDGDGWITSGVFGDRYIIGYESVSGRWYGIGISDEEMLWEYYGDAESLAEYGDPYTAILSRYYENNYDDQVLYRMSRDEPDAVELK